MHGLRSVLLEVGADDADVEISTLPRNDERPTHAERLVVLRDLVALGEVGIEVALAVKDRAVGYLAAQRTSQVDRPLDRRPVRDGQRAGVAETDRARGGVRLRTEPVRATAEHLRPRLQLDVDLETDDGFPAHARRSGTSSNASACSSAWPARKSVFSANCVPMS
jgi:hypothetical protein